MTELPTILIYHPNKIRLQRLVQFIQSAGYTALGASSESEALALVPDMKPHVFLIEPLVPRDLNIVEDIRTECPAARIVVLAGTDTIVEQAHANVDEVVLYDQTDIGNVLEALGRFVSAPKPAEALEHVGVLIVDDEPDTVDMFSEYLTQCGYSTVGALSGREAMDILKHNADVRVVLLDIHLPDVGGMELLREIIGLREPPAVIMLSAIRDSVIAKHSIRIGALDYLVKPVDLKALDEAIRVALARREYRARHWWNRREA